MALAPLAIAIPLIAAGLQAATAAVAARWAADALAAAAAVAVAVLSGLLVARASDGAVVVWMGNWRPRGPLALGVSLAVDPLGAALALFAALLTLAALAASRHLIEDPEHLLHVLISVFLAAVVGFAFSGDLFNLFVFFELMSVAAYALAGYRVEARAPLAGALSFGVTNSIGSFLVLSGVGLVYGRTGALNLAQIGRALDAAPVDALVSVAFALIVCGFLVKAAIVPFHFWLADAYASAPTPVCILFAGVMSEIGLYAVARVYWTAFAGVLGPHEEALRAILVGAGVLTALLGAVMSLVQRHLRRLLAFATVSYVGLFLCGLGLLSADGTAGAAVYVAGDGFAKAALFVCVGALSQCHRTVDEARLAGRGRGLALVGAVWALGGLAVAALPPFGSFVGKSLIDDAAHTAGYGWLPAVFVLASALTGAAVLRVAGRVFLGWGGGVEPDHTSETEAGPEIDEPAGRTPPSLTAVGVVLIAAALLVGVWPGTADAARRAAEVFTDHGGYARAVLDGASLAAPAGLSAPAPKPLDFALAAISVLGAVSLAALALQRVPAPPAPAVVRRLAGGALRRLRAAHSGHVGDYVAWLTAGTALAGGLFAIALR